MGQSNRTPAMKTLVMGARRLTTTMTAVRKVGVEHHLDPPLPEAGYLV